MARLSDMYVLGFCGLLFLFIDQRRCEDYSIPSLPTTNHHASLFILGDSLFDGAGSHRIIPDFIAGYAKLRHIPDYNLRPSKRDFTNGVNFANGGASALVEIHPESINLHTQLENFKKVKNVLKHKLGDIETSELLSRAVYLFSTGTNDYMTPFYDNYTTTFQSVYRNRRQYVDMVIGNITTVIERICTEGGRKFGFVGLWPVANFPDVRAFALQHRGVHPEKATAIVKLHNELLPIALKKLSDRIKGFKYSFNKFYDPVYDRIKNPSKYGFKRGDVACCGSGPYGGSGRCGVGNYTVCKNPNEYFFFDSAHPGERANRQFAKLMWSGDSSFSAPYNIEALFA